MNNNPKVSIVTSVFNGAKYLEETILSVINQSYKNIEYIIIDGGSTDGSVDIIKKYENKLAYWISEPDNGMYEGIQKGLQQVTGEICAYINSDDLYFPIAVETVVNVMTNHDEVKFLKGLDVIYNEKSFIVDVNIPYFPNRNAISKYIFGAIQQESTFWKSELNKSIDWEKFITFRLAGDHYLWYCFSRVTDLYIVNSCIGGFRHHKGQLSTDKKRYIAELKTFIQKKTVLDLFGEFYWRILKRLCNLEQWTKLSKNRFLMWDEESDTFI